MSSDAQSPNDSIIASDKLELTADEAKFAENQVNEAGDPVPDPATIMEDAEGAPQIAAALDAHEGPAAKWPERDQDAPDYHHFTDFKSDPSFALKPEDIELVLKANRFEPHGKFNGHDDSADEVIAIAVRGLALGKQNDAGTIHEVEDQASINVTDQRPDHRDFRCLVGFYLRTQDPDKRRLTLFSGSTVPNPVLMKAYRDHMIANPHGSFEKCNMLPTGCYVCRVDRHRTIRPALRMAEPSDLKRDARCTVLRTFNDLTFGLDDLWDPGTPYDNVHCSYVTTYNPKWEASFSSEGCITVRGKQTPSDQWAKFQAMLTKIGSQRRCDLVLVTGRDLAIAAKLRDAGQAGDTKVVERELGRLRCGSTGEEVRRLTSKLGLPDGDYFGATVRKALVDAQAEKSIPKDGIFSPSLDAQLGWNVFPSL